MKYLFVHICNALSKDGAKRPKFSVWFEAVMMLCAGTICWYLNFVALFYFYILNENFPAVPSSLVLIAAPFAIFYFVLIKDKKYEIIFEEYKDETPRQNKAGKIAGAIYIFTPMILGPLMSLNNLD